ncbi:MAG TPA: phosphatidate cytidylyltransferase [Rhodocyclaceae bacterium]|jgi:phosphatidate cytidylyltransferase|nr:phosphatidate cytidylyltransferase [Rhodocyclaceae bacterium]
MLKTRVITALFLLAGFVSVLFVLPDWAASFVFALVATLAAWEWGGLMQKEWRKRVLYAWITLAVTEYLSLSGLLNELLPIMCLAAVLFWLTVVPLWFKRRWPLPKGALGYLIGWLVILPTWLALVSLYRRDSLLLLAAMALVWIADIAAYFVGRTLGKHKLAPTISPGKTREGAVGALVAVMIYGFVLAVRQWPDASVLRLSGLALVLLVLTALSIIGDLYESLLKRQAGIKDSSNLLPGHGGILDRIDSQTSTLPLVALYFYWIAT